MAIKVITKYDPDATPKIWAYVYDDTGALVDPTGVTVDIYDPDGALQADGVAMTQSATGIYYYYYHKGASEDPMAKGKWRGEVKVADGAGDETIYSTFNFSFEVG